MFGKNPKRGPVTSSGKSLDVQDIFPTIQGEGPNVGMPAVFVRLGGCNLACKFCDTEFESFITKQTDDVISEVIKLSCNLLGKRIRNLVVITGGEPFRQSIEYLCERLIEEKFLVQIETNGTLYRELPNQVQIVCSPKSVDNYAPIREDILSRTNALKFLISAGDERYSFVPDVGQNRFNTEIYIQPMDEYNSQKNKANLELVKKLSEENGYKISLQMHKILGIP